MNRVDFGTWPEKLPPTNIHNCLALRTYYVCCWELLEGLTCGLTRFKIPSCSRVLWGGCRLGRYTTSTQSLEATSVEYNTSIPFLMILCFDSL